MTAYGLRKDQLDFIKKTIGKVFSKSESLEVYLFGSRSEGKHKPNSDIDIAIKSQNPIGPKLELLKEIFEESDIPYKLDLVEWNKVIPEYKKTINKQKKLIISSKKDLKISKWRICPVGEHWVKRHNKRSKSGKTGDWDGHCRINRSGKDVLMGDEIDMISTSKLFKVARPKVSKKTLGFSQGNDFDHLISGWTAYWNSIFKPKLPLHPNYVKALIASESSFKTRTDTKNKLKVGNAQGLVQLTEQTQTILKDKKGELRDHFVGLKKKDLWDPNKNIAAAVRWLFRKKETAKARLKKEPSWEQVVHEYKGILRQNNDLAKKIKSDYKDYLKRLNAKN